MAQFDLCGVQDLLEHEKFERQQRELEDGWERDDDDDWRSGWLCRRCTSNEKDIDKTIRCGPSCLLLGL